ncbi:MAG: pyridoxal-phosphate dependent enzyme [Planctomycetota bacterium]|nr:MAG: pyridoxal-phosphate dependent enzyme [Planctomycetota bacterium]
MTTSLAGANRGIADNILDLIGDTPLLRLPPSFAPGVEAEILLKFEPANPGGSVKDRIALAMIRGAEERGELRPGGTVVECTSGNTGAGLCLVAAALGYRSLIVIPDKMSQEKIDTLRAFGAEVVITPAHVPAGHPEHYLKVAERLAASIPGAWWANQFGNPDNPGAHYRTTGPEIWAQCDGRLDAFVAGCGTGGTITGTGRFLRERNPAVRIVGVDPPGSVYEPYWRTGELPAAGTYAVEGVGEDEIPDSWDREVVTDYEVVDDAESFAVARRLARETGIFVGGSAGLALAAGLRVGARLGAGKRVVVLIPDSGKNYLTKVYDPDWLRDNGFLDRVPAAAATVGDLVRRRPRAALLPEETLDLAWRQIADRGVRPLPVVAARPDGELLGVADEDRLLELLAAGSSPQDSISSARRR